MLVVGVDEAGRGPLVGSVVAAAVAFPPRFKIDGLTDSKKLSEKKRDALYNQITSECYWSYAQSNSQEIDDINILEATMLAMKRAVEGLKIVPELVLIDGNKAPDLGIQTQTIIKGDQSERCIMAASILAKVHRDNYMKDIDKFYPNYGFKLHKGYPTKLHLEALKSYGVTKEHRLSFKPVKNIYESN